MGIKAVLLSIDLTFSVTNDKNGYDIVIISKSKALGLLTDNRI
jgi:hypothetical protein